jgi:hypothetical protein
VHPWIEELQSADEIKRELKNANAPFTDNRSAKQIELYTENQAKNRRVRADLYQYENYKKTFATVPNAETPPNFPKSFSAFRKLKAHGGEDWQSMRQYFISLNNGNKNPGLTKATESGIMNKGSGYLNITGASGAIPRNDWTRMDNHAKMYYEEIRNRNGDTDIIAKNTGLAVENINDIKRHIFYNKYQLGAGDDELRHFDPSYDMAVSWQRLIDGKSIQEMDIVLLLHELTEYKLMCQGMPYREAHMKANIKYNYEQYCKELDRKDNMA